MVITFRGSRKTRSASTALDMRVPDPDESAVVRGITLSASGQAKIGRGIGRILFDLATRLENTVSYPVDVEHVLAAIVLAARQGELMPDHELVASDDTLVAILVEHVQAIFEKYDGRVSEDD